MSDIILIIGNVQYVINVDPSIFIVDKNHFPLSDRLPETTGLAMELGPILERSEPNQDAHSVICHRSQGEPITITLEQAKQAFLCFAQDGKPLREDGPAHLYLADGSNKSDPIRFLEKLEVC
ncbi:hypothetical protein [Risungbinella massiliensis]|uniref:hypothetical protein n=1 Tax=Risungbinella massiliensis TaxID=1329796 RepID=UPI000699D1AE|nr:hypothetical protein [Risungbinella massiliensis]